MSAEESARQANIAAQAVAQRHRELGDKMLGWRQELGREIADLRGEVNDGFAELAREIRSFKKPAGDISPSRHQLQSFTETEWEDSPTGMHKIQKVSKREFETWQREREMSADAKKWRKVLSIAWKVAGGVALVVAGWLVRHWMGKP